MQTKNESAPMSPRTQSKFDKIEQDRLNAIKNAEIQQQKALDLQAQKLREEAEKAAQQQAALLA